MTYPYPLMCGRFALNTDIEKILKQFPMASCEPLPISYNVAPTENALCLISDEAKIRGLQMRWGIIPWYAQNRTGKKPGLLINARAESVLEKPAFKQSMQKRRCVLIMSGFFEWQHPEEEKKKQPYFIEERHHELLAVAALWDWYKQPHQEAIPSFCLLTKEATSPVVKALHERMPWILSPFQTQVWLKEDYLSFNRLHELLEMDSSIDLIAYPVTASVNSALYKEKDSLKPIK